MTLRLAVILVLAVIPLKALFGGAPLWDGTSVGNPTALESPWPLDTPIRVCAIRVQFQQDSVTGTTGNGRFNERELWPATLKLDSWPHDSTYFGDHLRFIANYCSTLSRGRTTVGPWSVFPAGLDTAYTLGHPMWHYNYNTDQELLNQRLVELFVESIAASNTGEIDYSQFDAFIIFHAGVGKDFSFGFDETPFDIPSAYISPRDLENFRSLLPDSVTRGIILPEAENQKEALDFGVELSLNGISVKLFGNWLGLPDLFDTQTGRSGVGRWGMMDQGSGNVNALVPAAPDAWSRTYLGWDLPEVMILNNDPGDSVATWSLPIDPARGLSDVLKIPVTPREYYLLENRKTSADSDGCCAELFDRDGRRMRVQTDGDIVDVDPGFEIAIRASEYDIGVPGNGILLWHIDEDVIAAGLETNSINADREHRGVDLVEADGSQDIGYDFGFGSAGSGSSLGIAEDTWYEDNLANQDANNRLFVEFANTTVPSARLYDGAFTYLSLKEFSPVGDTMTFQARMTLGLPGGQFRVLLSAGQRLLSYRVADLDGDSTRELLAIVTDLNSAIPDTVFIFDSDGTSVALPAAGIDFARATYPSDIDEDGREEVLFAMGAGFGVIEESDGQIVLRSATVTRTVASIHAARQTSGLPMILTLEYAGAQPRAYVSLYDVNFVPLDSFEFNDYGRILNLESIPASLYAVVTEDSTTCFRLTESGIERIWQIPTGTNPSGAIVLIEPDRTMLWLSEIGYVNSADGSVVCSAENCDPPQVDWDGDGISDGGGPYGRDDDSREDFALPSPSEKHLFEDLDANGSLDIVGFSHYRLTASLHENHTPDGFPLAIPGMRYYDLVQWSADSRLEFVTTYVDSNQVVFSVNRFPVNARNADRFLFQEETAIINVGPKRPQVHDREDWVYCWPNPTSGMSYIRVTRSHPATAEVRLFDLAGRLVAELSGSSSTAGAFEIPWDVQGVESGVYIGRVEVTGGGRSDTREIKIAVVK